VATGLRALAVSRLPAIGGFGELVLDAGVGGLVYVAAALVLNAAGVRDLARRLLMQRRLRSATA
jgi:hypothetical protein